jgi:hypothetical protein
MQSGSQAARQPALLTVVLRDIEWVHNVRAHSAKSETQIHLFIYI